MQKKHDIFGLLTWLFYFSVYCRNENQSKKARCGLFILPRVKLQGENGLIEEDINNRMQSC